MRKNGLKLSEFGSRTISKLSRKFVDNSTVCKNYTVALKSPAKSHVVGYRSVAIQGMGMENPIFTARLSDSGVAYKDSDGAALRGCASR
jgi:hypothetical protein